MKLLRVLAKYLAISVALLLGVIMHLAWQGIFSAPFNAVNIVFIFVLGLVLYFRSIKIIWTAIILGFVLEIFSVSPFGIIMFSLLAGVWVGGWILLRLLSSYTLLVVFFATLVGIAIYRVTFYGLLWGFDIFGLFDFVLTTAIIGTALLEAISSALLMTGLYFIGSKFIRRLRPEYLNTKQAYYYGRR